MYEYDNIAAEKSLNSANKAVTALETVPSNMSAAAFLAPLVQVPGLEFLRDKSYVENIEIISNYPSIIIDMISKAEENSTIEGIRGEDNILLKRGYNPVTVAGVDGYLYVPPGDITGKSIVTWLSGVDQYAKQNALNQSGIAHLLSKGYAPDSVIWIPTGTYADGWGDVDMKNVTNSVNVLTEAGGLDPQKKVLIGYSYGGLGGFHYIAENPGVYSTFVSYGAYADPDDYDKIANSETSIIVMAGTRDSGPYNRATNTFEELNNRGADVMMYSIDGATHSEDEKIITKELLEDVANRKIGETYVQSGKGKIINVSYSEFNDSSIEQKLANGNNNSATYYKSLASTTQENKNNESYAHTLVDSNVPANNNVKTVTTVAETSNNIVKSVTTVTATPNNDVKPVITATATSNNEVKPVTTATATSNNTNSGTTSNSTSNYTHLGTVDDVASNTTESLTSDTILPNSKFQAQIPQLTSGKLEFMEISDNSVVYNLNCINNDTYNKYIQDLVNKGYNMLDSGIFVKDGYTITTTYNKDGHMSIELKMM